MSLENEKDKKLKILEKKYIEQCFKVEALLERLNEHVLFLNFRGLGADFVQFQKRNELKEKE